MKLQFFNVQSALLAESCGADRIELCENSAMEFINENMNETIVNISVDEDEIKKMKAALNQNKMVNVFVLKGLNHISNSFFEF